MSDKKMNEMQKGFVLSAIEMAKTTSDDAVEKKFQLAHGTIEKLRKGIEKFGGIDNMPGDFLKK